MVDEKRDPEAAEVVEALDRMQQALDTLRRWAERLIANQEAPDGS